jgi:hypothetical protein
MAAPPPNLLLVSLGGHGQTPPSGPLFTGDESARGVLLLDNPRGAGMLQLRGARGAGGSPWSGDSLGLLPTSDPVESARDLMAATYSWPPWLSGSYHPGAAASSRCRAASSAACVEQIHDPPRGRRWHSAPTRLLCTGDPYGLWMISREIAETKFKMASPPSWLRSCRRATRATGSSGRTMPWAIKSLPRTPAV